MSRRKATPTEINSAFAAKRIALGRFLSFAEVQALDAQLAEDCERDDFSDYDQLMSLSLRLKQYGEKEIGSPVRSEDLQLCSFCAGMLAGLAGRIRALEAALVSQARLI